MTTFRVAFLTTFDPSCTSGNYKGLLESNILVVIPKRGGRTRLENARSGCWGWGGFVGDLLGNLARDFWEERELISLSCFVILIVKTITKVV